MCCISIVLLTVLKVFNNLKDLNCFGHTIYGNETATTAVDRLPLQGRRCLARGISRSTMP